MYAQTTWRIYPDVRSESQADRVGRRTRRDRSDQPDGERERDHGGRSDVPGEGDDSAAEGDS